GEGRFRRVVQQDAATAQAAASHRRRGGGRPVRGVLRGTVRIGVGEGARAQNAGSHRPILWQTAGALMTLPYEYFIGLRYTRAGRRTGRRNGFISFISGLSVAGIALGVAALIIVLSVMNGFQKEVRDRMLSVLSHIEVLAGSSPIHDWPALVAQATERPDIVAGAPFVRSEEHTS